ncbi:MAG: PIN domain-containing protein [Alphaproteobacteria bacterium]|nr:PIN domain-containing protein [Alphaproteobacteria bacterium]
MIAVDSSVVIDYLMEIDSPQTRLMRKAVEDYFAVIPAIVITELLSNPSSTGIELAERFLTKVEPMEIEEGYWERAGKSRAKLKAKGLKAKTADALIAQSCIDSGAALLTRDEDFAHYAKHCGLKLVSF